jgi:hypothetical protein
MALAELEKSGRKTELDGNSCHFGATFWQILEGTVPPRWSATRVRERESFLGERDFFHFPRPGGKKGRGFKKTPGAAVAAASTGEGGGRVSLRDTFCAGIKVELL